MGEVSVFFLTSTQSDNQTIISFVSCTDVHETKEIVCLMFVHFNFQLNNQLELPVSNLPLTSRKDRSDSRDQIFIKVETNVVQKQR